MDYRTHKNKFTEETEQITQLTFKLQHASLSLCCKDK